MMDMWKIALLRPEKLMHMASHTVLCHNTSMDPFKNLRFKQVEMTTGEHLYNFEMRPGHFEHYFQKQASGEENSHPTSAFFVYGKHILQLYFSTSLPENNFIFLLCLATGFQSSAFSFFC